MAKVTREKNLQELRSLKDLHGRSKSTGALDGDIKAIKTQITYLTRIWEESASFVGKNTHKLELPEGINHDRIAEFNEDLRDINSQCASLAATIPGLENLYHDIPNVAALIEQFAPILSALNGYDPINLADLYIRMRALVEKVKNVRTSSRTDIESVVQTVYT